ncbi:MAG: hypothetical protein HOI95_11120 [Chromatiales bacterium]|jgi:3',5'-nucleoside bisphosphate phosphatase|nr:hypothetical protein [Chromatiales bacterium]
MTNTKLLALVDDFRAAGGRGLEVVSGRQIPSVTQGLADICAAKQLTASCGSDFHEPGQTWAALGRCARLPKSCIPVWEHW